MSAIPTVMALYSMNLLSGDDVIAWADEQILLESEPIEYVSELSLRGPGVCYKMAGEDFPSARDFKFSEEFALRTCALDTDSEKDINEYVRWITSAVIGLDFEIPGVHFGYLLDEYFNEGYDSEYAMSYFMEKIVAYRSALKPIANSIWLEVGPQFAN